MTADVNDICCLLQNYLDNLENCLSNKKTLSKIKEQLENLSYNHLSKTTNN